jgi:hypothetical protein
MNFMIITVSNLIWIAYSLTEGVREGFSNHYRNTYRSQIRYNFKRMVFMQRLLVLFATGGVMFHTIGLISIPFILGQILMFSFLHKLSYNCTVSKIEKMKIEEKVDTTTPEIKVKEPMIMLGITLQIFIYLFFM